MEEAEWTTVQIALGQRLFAGPDLSIMSSTGLHRLGMPELSVRSTDGAGNQYVLDDDDLYLLLLSSAERLRSGMVPSEALSPEFAGKRRVPLLQQLWDYGSSLATIWAQPASAEWAEMVGQAEVPRRELTWTVVPWDDVAGSGQPDSLQVSRAAATWFNDGAKGALPATGQHVQPYGRATSMVLALRDACVRAGALDTAMAMAMAWNGQGRVDEISHSLEQLPEGRELSLYDLRAAALEDSRAISAAHARDTPRIEPGASSLITLLMIGYSAWTFIDLLPEERFYGLYGLLQSLVAPDKALERLLVMSPRAAALHSWQSSLSIDEVGALGQAALASGAQPLGTETSSIRVPALTELVLTGSGYLAGNHVLMHLLPGPLSQQPVPVAQSAICIVADAIVAAAIRDLAGRDGADREPLASGLEVNLRRALVGAQHVKTTNWPSPRDPDTWLRGMKLLGDDS